MGGLIPIFTLVLLYLIMMRISAEVGKNLYDRNSLLWANIVK